MQVLRPGHVSEWCGSREHRGSERGWKHKSWRVEAQELERAMCDVYIYKHINIYIDI